MTLSILEQASKSYYEGNPTLSDEEFDSLAAKYQDVGYKVEDGISHYMPMFSLQKFFSLDDARKHFKLEGMTVTPKFDGAAISMLFIDGSLMLALTRGDGNKGKDITDKMRLYCSKSTPTDKGIRFITGEIVAPKRIKNSRNFAAGALNLKDINEFHINKLPNLEFIVYDSYPALSNSYIDNLEQVRKRYPWMLIATEGSFVEEYPTDGQVYRIDDIETWQLKGYTAHHPKGSFALKTQKEGVTTILRDVTWQVGKSGVITPVAHFDNVHIDGAVINRATLHNIEYIESLDLEIGCKIKVVRSGDIIPRVVERVAD